MRNGRSVLRGEIPEAGCVAILFVAHAALCWLARALGFDHVSDDDFARVTIAQAFAQAPRLDPSGTSWLPFPFWALGSIMAIFGRSLVVARIASVAFASAAATLPYLALRGTGASRGRALAAFAFATMSPWSLWLGAATVPESFTASLSAAAVIALGASVRAAMPSHRRPSFASATTGATAMTAAAIATIPTTSKPTTCSILPALSPRVRVAFALGLLAACLSRYEPWPVAAVLAIVLAARALRGIDRTRATIASIVILAAGPLAWMAWNALAHGDALHFFERVSQFRRASGEGPSDPLGALLLYPRLLLVDRPDVVVGIALALAAARASLGGGDLLRRWRVPLVCAGAQIAFLAIGNVRDGAPTHHPDRAILGTVVILAAFDANVLLQAASAGGARARLFVVGAVAIVGAAWIATGVRASREIPGTTSAEERFAQIARGFALRLEGAPELVVTPCAYEHFALIAAYGAPERVTVRLADRSRGSVTCPLVERR